MPEFEQLLNLIHFDSSSDQLLLAGDLVSRGPDSLGMLRRVYQLRDHVTMVLGNHDLHLLALRAGVRQLRKKESDLQAILKAPDAEVLLDWLQHQPLFHRQDDHNAVLVHAGIPPGWTLQQTADRAREVEAILRSNDSQRFFDAMYGNQPAGWHDDLLAPERWRVITNYLTRMRFVNRDGEMELSIKGEADQPPEGYFPWFEHPDRKTGQTRIVFGHWAALGGKINDPYLRGLDTGCVYGGKLSALRLEDDQLFQQPCPTYKLVP